MRNISSHCIIYSLDFPRLSSYFLSGLRSYLDTVSTFSKTYNSCSTSVTRCFRFRTHTVLPRLALWWLYFYLSNGGRKKATGWSCYLDTFFKHFQMGDPICDVYKAHMDRDRVIFALADGCISICLIS